MWRYDLEEMHINEKQNKTLHNRLHKRLHGRLDKMLLKDEGDRSSRSQEVKVTRGQGERSKVNFISI